MVGWLHASIPNWENGSFFSHFQNNFRRLWPFFTVSRFSSTVFKIILWEIVCNAFLICMPSERLRICIYIGIALCVYAKHCNNAFEHSFPLFTYSDNRFRIKYVRIFDKYFKFIFFSCCLLSTSFYMCVCVSKKNPYASQCNLTIRRYSFQAPKKTCQVLWKLKYKPALMWILIQPPLSLSCVNINPFHRVRFHWTWFVSFHFATIPERLMLYVKWIFYMVRSQRKSLTFFKLYILKIEIQILNE